MESTDLTSCVHLPSQKNKNKTDKLLYIFIIAAYTTITLSTIGLTQGFPVISSIAKSKGLLDIEIGLIYCLQAILCAFLFPISSVILTKVNKKLALCVCSLLVYCSFILYGFIISMSRTPFLIFSLIFSCVEAYCETMIFLSANLILWETFPDRQSTMFAMQEVTISIGYVSGPSICAILYPLIGFSHMYLLIGILGLIVSLVITATLVLSKTENKTMVREQADPLLILRIILTPSLSLHLVVTFTTAFFFNYFYPVIGPYLISRYDVTVSTVGWVIMSGELVYMVCSIILGYMYDNYIHSLHIVVAALGLFTQAIGIFLYPPSSLISNKGGNYLTFSIFGSIFNGLGIALCFIPILTSLLMKAEERFPGVSNVEPSVAGLFTGAYYLGEGAGQFISEVIADFYSLDVISTYLAGFVLIFSVVLLLIGVIKFRELKMLKHPFKRGIIN
ncbi:hypothetical protein LOD99_3234 [Oopsacas minuta]|uniref:Major facilitator superfamily (MFS) profile domain-containing protein n=1 Tax=Oopsacas minuta TaxID=111878 RepID=A0AAV7JY49_9METZ|nr:hypothetical protein LOD99_3234 [Oopsacas minuta]